MDYYKDLKKADHVEHIRPGLAVGFTFEQIDQHGFINLCLKWGLNKADIIEIVVPNAGSFFLFLLNAPKGKHQEDKTKNQYARNSRVYGLL